MTPSPAGTLIRIKKQSSQGNTLFTYTGWLLNDGDPMAILARWELPDLHKTYTTFARGDLLLEVFYRQRPYNIFALFAGQKIPPDVNWPQQIATVSPKTISAICQSLGSHCALKGYYINFTRPVHYDSRQHCLAWRDVALDMWIPAQGPPQMLDEADYRALNLPERDPQLARDIENARQSLLNLARTNAIHQILNL